MASGLGQDVQDSGALISALKKAGSRDWWFRPLTTWEAEAGELPSVKGKPGLYSEFQV